MTTQPPRLNNERWVAEQYKTPHNLNARAQLHNRFSINPYPWLQWVFDHLSLTPGTRLLEIGGGPGSLWHENRQRLSPAIEIIFTDQSTGMITQAISTLGDLPQFRFGVADAQSLPFATASFDVVIANHMLYHVPDRERAVAEIRRVLRPTGRFFAATNDHAHMQELRELPDAYMLGLSQRPSSNERFPFDAATEKFSQHFGQVQLHRYHNGLVIPDANALADYMLSGIMLTQLPADGEAAFRQWLHDHIATQGPLKVTSAVGLFESTSAI
jgi:SAM-dependent methyltransferase